MNTLRLLSEFHAGLADPRRHVARDVRAGERRDGPRPRRGRPASSSTRPGRSSGSAGDGSSSPTADDGRDGRGACRVPLPGRPLGPADLRPRRSAPAPTTRRSRRSSPRSCPIYFGRVGSFVIENRHHHDRAGRGSRRAPGPRVRAAQAVPRRALARPPSRRPPRPAGRAGVSAPDAAPGADPHPGRQPGHRRGADPPRRRLLDPRAGELTALGIVEVPEGMPLSEGATRARHARRLLQRVLDFAPDGTTIHPIVRIGRHAAEGIVEASAEQEADLIIFGWGGKAPAGRDGAARGLLADDRRGRPRLAGRHRGRQAARQQGDPADRRPGPRRPPRRARDPLRRRDRPAPRRHGQRPPLRPARDHARRPGPGRARPRPVRPAAPQGPAARASSARRPTSATRSSARPSGPTSS